MNDKKEKRKCKNCEKEFIVYKSQPTKFCSRGCFTEYRNKSSQNNPNWKGGKITEECEYCGDEFKVNPNKAGQAYCSRSCALRGRSEKRIKQIKEVGEKKCTKCGEVKELSEFYKRQNVKLGYSSWCRKCAYENVKEWREENSDLRNETRRKRRLKPSKKINISVGTMMRRSLKESKMGRHWEDLVGYTADDLKEHLEEQFEDWMTWNNLGRIDEEKRTWNIDHIKPKSKFDFDSPEEKEFKKCWALDNLQPLDARKNLRKNNSYESKNT